MRPHEKPGLTLGYVEAMRFLNDGFSQSEVLQTLIELLSAYVLLIEFLYNIYVLFILDTDGVYP